MARLRALGVALLATGLLCATAACQDEPKPDIADPTPTSPAPSPTESSPTTSPTAEALTPEETVRAWVDAQNTALETGDTGGLVALAASDCADCAEFVKSIDDVYAAGGHFEGGRWRFVRGTLDQESASVTVFTCGIRIAAGSVVKADGAPPESYPADSLLFKFGLGRSGPRWTISTIKVVT